MENKKFDFRFLKSKNNLYAYARGYIIALQYEDEKWSVAKKDYFIIKQKADEGLLEDISEQDAMEMTNGNHPGKSFGDIAAVYYKESNNLDM